MLSVISASLHVGTKPVICIHGTCETYLRTSFSFSFCLLPFTFKENSLHSFTSEFTISNAVMSVVCWQENINQHTDA